MNIKLKILCIYLKNNFNFFKIKKIIENSIDIKNEKNKDELEKFVEKLDISEEILAKHKIESLENIKFFFEEDFPDILHQNNAGVIFFKGNWNLLNDKNLFKIAVVGSRKPTTLTTKWTEELMKLLMELENICVISGLATGIDTIALKNSKIRISILGNGIDYYYPPTNKKLQQRIVEEGLILSEYPPKQPPQKYFFPYRNRLISALADLVIVIQAAKNSGSITTGKYALEMGKELLVPFISASPEFEGSKELINNGGIIVTKPEEILNYLPFSKKIDNKNVEENINILKIISNKPGITIEELSYILNIPIPKTIEIVTSLELEGKIFVDFNYSIFIK